MPPTKVADVKVEERGKRKIQTNPNSDNEEIRMKSKIPRLSKGSVQREIDSKPTPAVLEYNNSQMVTPNKPQAMRRSQSFLENKNANSSKEGNINDLKRNGRDKVISSANKILEPSNLTGNRSNGYKPYTLREYKEKVN